jgi:hypothetical protein
MGDTSKGSRGWVMAGLAAMLIGALDPLEGSLLILPGCALATFGVHQAPGRARRWLVTGFVLMALGVAYLWAISSVGGFGGDTGRTWAWAWPILPYPLGWLLGLAGAIRFLWDTRAGLTSRCRND